MITTTECKKCSRCGKLTTPTSGMNIRNVFGKYAVQCLIREKNEPVCLCQDCAERIVYAAAKQLWDDSGLKED